MKKIILVFLLVVASIFAQYSAFSCDLCGCAVGNFYMGVMPQFQKNFIGLRYRSSTYNSHVGLGKLFETQEAFQSAEIFARFYPHKKVQIITFLPYLFNAQQTSSDLKKLQGLGDASILVNYRLFANDTTMSNWKHNWFVGGGIKLPFGRYEYQENNDNQVANANFQLGSGSVDFILNSTYTLRYKKIGLSTDLSYKINTKNSANYQFGNKISGNANLFWVKTVGKFAFMPYLGIYYENANYDKKNGVENSNTGGTLLMQNLGFDIYFKRFVLGGNFQMPLEQNLAKGQIKANERFLIQFLYVF